MKPSLEKKLLTLRDRYEALKVELADPNIINDRNHFRDVSKEYAQLEPHVKAYEQYEDLMKRQTETEELLQDADSELQQLAKQELKTIAQELEKLEEDLLIALLPKDPHDESNIFLEIRAGAGGDEAAIFAGDLCRMYLRYAESEGYKVEMLSESVGEKGGYKEVIIRIIGHGAYSKFKFESGVHRVQRVPETEAQGRVHTSTCTIAILPEVEEIDNIDINPADLRIDTFRASGAGCQHV